MGKEKKETVDTSTPQQTTAPLINLGKRSREDKSSYDDQENYVALTSSEVEQLAKKQKRSEERRVGKECRP